MHSLYGHVSPVIRVELNRRLLTGVRLFDRYEYLLISLMNRLYWESPGVSGCFRQGPQWLLLVSVVSVVRAGKGRDGIRPRVPRVRGPCPG